MSTDAFDKAFKPEEPIIEVMKRILEHFELDFFQERPGAYSVRVWREGEHIVTVTDFNGDLEHAIRGAGECAANQPK
jgi:hypothetical protein